MGTVLYSGHHDYKIECYDTTEKIEGIIAEWRNLVGNSCANWIYSLPEWSLSWHKTLGQEGQLKIIIVRDKKKALVGLAPMWQGPASWSELKVNKMEFASGVQADYHDLIVQKGKEETIAPILMEGIMHFLNKIDVLEFRQIPEESPNLPFIRNYLKREKIASFEQQEVSSYCYLEGDYSNMEKRWSASHRGDIRRQKKKLNELGKLQLMTYTEDEEMLNDIEDFFKMHTDRWHSAGYPAMFLNPKYCEFYREIIKSIGAQSGIHFSKLTLDGLPISFHLGFVYNDRLYWYKPTFKTEYANYSPSKIHISMLMEEGFKQGWSFFDFLIGNEPYKYQWDVKELSCITIVVRGRRVLALLGYEWLRWGKELFKRTLKGRFLEKIRALYIEGRRVKK